MGGSYKGCPTCGARALSIATRCPGCGGEFLAGEEPNGTGRRLPRLSIPLSAPAVVLAGIGIVVASQVGRTASVREERSSLGAAVTADVPTEVGAAGTGAVPDSVAATPAGRAPPLAAAVLVTDRTIYLRQARSRSAALEAVLEPGDTLAVDSLSGGWYRVRFEGAVMGYAEGSRVDSLVFSRGS